MDGIKKIGLALGLASLLSFCPNAASGASNLNDCRLPTKYGHISCTRIYYDEPLAPTSNRGEETRSFEIIVPKGSNLERLSQELTEINRSNIFDQLIRNDYRTSEDSYFWRGFSASWKTLYEQNKQVIGDNPNCLKEGTKLKYQTPIVIIPGTHLSM